MPELRKDPIIGGWIIVATEREKGPISYKSPQQPIVRDGFCPVCPGNEDKTSPEIYAFRPNGGKPSRAGISRMNRLFPNSLSCLRRRQHERV